MLLKDLEMYRHRCQLPFLSFYIKTPPMAYFEVSVANAKGLSGSGMASTGSFRNMAGRSLNAYCGSF